MNPFATSGTGLGQIEFAFGPCLSLISILARLRDAGNQGQIVGPHGSGKTTLTIAIADFLADQFTQFWWLVIEPTRFSWQPLQVRVQLNKRLETVQEQIDVASSALAGEADGGRRLSEFTNRNRDLLIVDGIELAASSRFHRLWSDLKQQRQPVIFTAHQPLPDDVPLLATLDPSREVFHELVGKLTYGLPPVISTADIDEAFTRTSGDAREAFGLLYDTWESRCRAANRC